MEVTRSVTHILHWPQASLGHIPTLWQKEKRFLGLMSRSHRYSAPRLCTLPGSQTVGSVSLGGTGNGCWVDNMGICHLHPSQKAQCLLRAQGPCCVRRDSREQDAQPLFLGSSQTTKPSLSIMHFMIPNIWIISNVPEKPKERRDKKDKRIEIPRTHALAAGKLHL